jgi:uncharacterized protein (TIGR03000 family)
MWKRLFCRVKVPILVAACLMIGASTCEAQVGFYPWRRYAYDSYSLYGTDYFNWWGATGGQPIYEWGWGNYGYGWSPYGDYGQPAYGWGWRGNYAGGWYPYAGYVPSWGTGGSQYGIAGWGWRGNYAGGWYPYGGFVPYSSYGRGATAAPAVAAGGSAPAAYQISYPPDNNNGSQDGYAATIELYVPATAEVTVDGQKTQQTGPVRTLTTPPLSEAKTYNFEIRVTWKDKSGKDVTQTRKVQLAPRQQTMLNFTDPG